MLAPADHLDGLVLERLVRLEEVLDLDQAVRSYLFEPLDVLLMRVTDSHAQHLEVEAFLVAHLEPAREAVRAAGTGAAGFDLVLGTAGAFPEGGRPRTLWVDVIEGAAHLAGLAGRLDAALVDAGWPPETRPFKAHLTLARSDGVPAGRAIAQSLMDEAADLRIPARIDRIGLFESLTGGGPARYEPLEIVQLG